MPHRGTPPPVVHRRIVIGVMGSGREPHAHLSAPLGAWLATTGCHLLTGGGRGVMELCSKTFSEAEGREGLVIGVVPALPGSQHEDNIIPPSGYPNPYTEVVIRTQCPLSMHPMTGTELTSRNHINILSSDIVVALPGSSGTWSEIQLAIRYRKPLILFLGEEGGEIELALEEFEDIKIAKNLDEVKEFVTAAIERRRLLQRSMSQSSAGPASSSHSSHQGAAATTSSTTTTATASTESQQQPAGLSKSASSSSEDGPAAPAVNGSNGHGAAAAAAANGNGVAAVDGAAVTANGGAHAHGGGGEGGDDGAHATSS